jgi:hypothetical protein
MRHDNTTDLSCKKSALISMHHSIQKVIRPLGQRVRETCEELRIIRRGGLPTISTIKIVCE